MEKSLNKEVQAVEVTEELQEHVVELFSTIAQECLAENDPDAYQRVFKIMNDDDYDFAFEVRELNSEDLFDEELGDSANLYCAEVHFLAADGSLKNDIHVVDLYFMKNYKDDEDQSASANWFPEE